jgi:hypothetical protein
VPFWSDARGGWRGSGVGFSRHRRGGGPGRTGRRPRDFEPAELPTANELTVLGSRTLDDRTWTVAGYGTQVARDPDRAHLAGGERLEATVDFNALNASWVRLAMNEGPGLGAACYGDSGGPKYVDLGGGRELLAAITITGDVFDDVVAIELRAIAGATYPLVDGSFTPDAAASAVDDGVGPDDVGMPYLDRFPYLGLPHSGLDVPAAAA